MVRIVALDACSKWRHEREGHEWGPDYPETHLSLRRENLVV